MLKAESVFMFLDRISTYLNPIKRLGTRNYSVFLPLFVICAVSILSEFFAKVIVGNTAVVSFYAIFLYIILIIYFAFRDGIPGGATATIATLCYYTYIVIDRDTSWEQKNQQADVVIVLGAVYFFLAGIIGWLKQTIDILIEREADERSRLEAIIEQLPVGVGITDAMGRLVKSNKRIEQLIGRPIRANLVAGRDTSTIARYLGKPVKPEDWPLAETLATGRPVVGKNFEISREDGEVVHVQISAAVVRNARGRIIAAATIWNDITQEKELEQRKDDFINMASHELKTPLTSMKLYIDMLDRKLDANAPAQLTTLVSRIRRQSERLQALINTLLDVSRMQTGKIALECQTYDVSKQIKTIVANLQPVVKQPISIVSTQPYSVYADEFRVDQVLVNIITNAAKYSPPNKPITISYTQNKHWVQVSITDEGIGISKRQQQKIFDRLYQVTGLTANTFPGLGLGLYISKEIVTQHGGKIWVESSKGKGATFHFTLPTPS